MSVTEWVYNKYSSDENGLQESKNFVLIWGLFESQIMSCIGNLRTSDFVSWVQVLEIKKEQNGISIKEPSTHKYINTELIGYINDAFNHFFKSILMIVKNLSIIFTTKQIVKLKKLKKNL